jgi:hypothetical protein
MYHLAAMSCLGVLLVYTGVDCMCTACERWTVPSLYHLRALDCTARLLLASAELYCTCTAYEHWTALHVQRLSTGRKACVLLVNTGLYCTCTARKESLHAYLLRHITVAAHVPHAQRQISSPLLLRHPCAVKSCHPTPPTPPRSCTQPAPAAAL